MKKILAYLQSMMYSFNANRTLRVDNSNPVDATHPQIPLELEEALKEFCTPAVSKRHSL